MVENNAICAICGKPYHICIGCKNDMKIKPWRIITDTIDCYKIYLAIHKYTVGKNKTAAKEALEKCNLTSLERLKPEIIDKINEIRKDDVVFTAPIITERTTNKKRSKNRRMTESSIDVSTDITTEVSSDEVVVDSTEN